MKTTFKRMGAVNFNEIITIIKPVVQTLGIGAATVVLKRMGVPSEMINKLVSAAIVNM